MSLNRREFVAGTVAAGTALGVFGSQRALAAETSQIRVAQIGSNGRGGNHIEGLRKNIVALCDVDQNVLDRRSAEIKKKSNRTVDTYTDYRELLKRDDIDAVAIATPNHTHAIIAIAAAQAGKDVYVEKPVSHNVWEGRQLAAAARKYKRVIQCGTQSRSSPSLQQAVEFVRSGQLGDVQFAIGTCYKPRKSIGRLEQPLEIPKSIDYDLWCGPAEKRELYRPKLHYDWHWDYNTGNGDMGNQGIHQMDIARWFLGEDKLAPRWVSVGGRLGYDDAGDSANTQITYFDYPRAPLLFETRGLPRSKAAQSDWGGAMDHYRGSRVGVIVQCTEGHVLVPSYYKAMAYDRQGKHIKTWEGGGDHYANWLTAVAAQDASLLNAEILEGHLSSALCHMGMVSHLLGEKVEARGIGERLASHPLLSDGFERMAAHLRANDVNVDSMDEALTLGPWLDMDPDTESIGNHNQANAMLRREYRKPFEVPQIA